VRLINTGLLLKMVINGLVIMGVGNLLLFCGKFWEKVRVWKILEQV
jgi:hypothetical protein